MNAKEAREFNYEASGVLFEQDVQTHDGDLLKRQEGFAQPWKTEIMWNKVISISLLHIGAVYGVLLISSASWKTDVFAMFYYIFHILGISAGSHRLWSHRSYKATFPLRVILMIFQTIGYQNSVMYWARDHRVHHKYTETDADPHNATRGFFFSHIGWLFCRSHPDLKEAWSKVDISDLKADPVVRFQDKFYYPLTALFCFTVPTMIPMYIWGETFENAFFIAAILRLILASHVTLSVNSFAHLWGDKPYDKNINPSEITILSVLHFGEGWHNYHHVFPWDYKAAEFGNFTFNFTTCFIDFFAKIGWAYDLKSVSKEIIQKRAERTGDLSHKKHNSK